jgi:influenza virus NS1A-binding protein
MPDGIYAIGGYNGKDYISTVERYNITENTWESICDLNSSKCTMSAVVSPDFQSLFVIGGFNGVQLNEIEQYDPLT